MAGELHGCLELNDNGCITTFQILLSHGQLAEAAAEALLVVATHTPDLLVLTGAVPRMAQALSRLRRSVMQKVCFSAHMDQAIHSKFCHFLVFLDSPKIALRCCVWFTHV
eukprot:m.244732 g.244732  ORF g.244732 m.244732 type:complete len:110 (-) comp17149_c1_seq13:13320-13649(-)